MRPERGIDDAVRRLRDERQYPLHELAAAGESLELNGVTVRLSAVMMHRWGCDGKRGVYLDVLYSRQLAAWVTSREALARFARDFTAKVRQAG